MAYVATGYWVDGYAEGDGAVSVGSALYVATGYWVDGYAEGEGGGFRGSGGWDSDYAERFLRRIKLGSDEVTIEDDEQLEREVAQRIGAIPIDAHSLRWPDVPQPKIDWAAVASLRRQAIRLKQPEVEAAITKAIKEWRDADDEDVLKLSSLLHEDDTKERIIQVFSALRDAIDGARAAEIERDSAPPPPPPPTDAERLERLAISLNDLVKMMAAPREIIRDESGRAIGIAPIYERGASGSIDEAIANISDGLDVLASPRELVRDPKTAKLRGLH